MSSRSRTENGTDAPGGSQIFKAPPAWWLGQPVDVAAEENSEWTGTNVVAVATTPLTYPYHASNARLYDVSDDNQWKWTGAVSLGREPTDGMIRRIRLKGPTLYGLTAGMGKGFQIVDLDMVRGAFDAATSGGEQTAAFWNMQGQLNSTSGFAQGTILQTIHIPTGAGENSQMWDMAILEMPVDGVTETAMVSTGRMPLAIGSQNGGLVYHGEILNQDGVPVTSWGFAIGAGVVNGTPIAAVSAIGAAGPSSPNHVLAIVDLSNPRAPRALSVTALPGSPYGAHDVVVRDTTVFIGTTTGTLVVNIADPSQPLLMGSIPGVSGRLAFGDNGVLFGTYRGLAQVSNAEGGLRAAALAEMAVITSMSKALVVTRDDESSTVKAVTIKYSPVPSTAEVRTSEVRIFRNDSQIQVLPGAFVGSQGSASWAAGLVDLQATYWAEAVINPGETTELRSKRIEIPLLLFNFDLSPDEVSEITADERAAYISAHVSYDHPTITDTTIAVDDGSAVRWTVIEGSGTISPVTSSTRSGMAVTKLNAVSTPNHRYRVRAAVSRVTIDGEEFQVDAEADSAEMMTVPGAPASIVIERSKTSYRSDSTDLVQLSATVRDAFSNLVADGTSVSWLAAALRQSARVRGSHDRRPGRYRCRNGKGRHRHRHPIGSVEGVLGNKVRP